MKKLCLFFINFSLVIQCVNLNNINDQKEENKKLGQANSLLLIANSVLIDYNSGLPVNNMLFRYSVIDSQNIVLSLAQYCVNIYTLVGLDPNKIITEWQSLTKYPNKCALNNPRDFKCITSKNIYINEIMLPASLGLTAAENLCNNEAKGTILVY
ncbi:hypothetical protein [Leptospira wolbachii]|uniref:hypothetical protein n=1 Tax=Leptospira wolbachii TaxID=29511 RepID=UPI00058B7524|nr:hypothetical protein [Leptospira wolbachii]